jgi:uncharacterized protein (TIGR00661 family)
LNLTKSVAAGLKFLWQLPRIVSHIADLIRREAPDLAVSDFEPALPRAATRCGLPLLAINHQSFTLAYDLSVLPVSLRWYAWWIAQVVRAQHTAQAATVISAFFRPPVRAGVERVTQVGPLLRPELAGMAPSDGDFLVSYLRPFTPAHVLETLGAAGHEVRVYGLGERPACGPLRFRAIDERTYVEDLAQCAAYVGAAGNQSLGELLYFGKPVLALPERNHHEQLINSHFLRHMGVGTFVPLDRFRQSDLQSFMDRREEFGARLVPYRGRLDGTPDTLAAIRRHLPRTTAPVTSLRREETLAVSLAPITQLPVPARGVS